MQSVHILCPLQGLNLGPYAYEAHALPLTAKVERETCQVSTLTNLTNGDEDA